MCDIFLICGVVIFGSAVVINLQPNHSMIIKASVMIILDVSPALRNVSSDWGPSALVALLLRCGCYFLSMSLSVRSAMLAKPI